MIEQLFESLISASVKFNEWVKNLEKLAENVIKLSQTVLKLSQTVQSHHTAINELIVGYQAMANLLKNISGLDQALTEKDLN